MCRRQQSVPDAAQRRKSGTVADGTPVCGKIGSKAGKVGLDVGQMEKGAASGGLKEASCDVQTTAVSPRCSPEKKVRHCG